MDAVNQYIFQVIDAIKNQDGKKFAKLLQIFGDDTPTARLELDLRKIRDIDGFCSGKIETNYGKVIPSHILAFLRYKDGKWTEAFASQKTVVSLFLSAIQDDTRWALPALYTIILDLRLIAKRADAVSKAKRQRAPNEETKLNETAAILMNCFRIIYGDRSNSLETSKRWGTLYIVNSLFKVYFQLNTVSLCKELIKAVERPEFPDLQGFPISHLVTYKYYSGRMKLFNGQYKEAAEALSFAFRRCLSSKVKNRRQILISLVPVRMCLGKFPKPTLLQKYKLKEFMVITTAIKSGNLRDYHRAMEQYQDFYITQGIYLVLEKLKLLTYRNLFKKIYLILGKKEKIPLKLFVDVCLWLGIEMDMDQMECILVNLIYKRYIKGYLSHSVGFIVLSDKNPFPSFKNEANTIQ